MVIFIPIKETSQRVVGKNFIKFRGLPMYQYVISKFANEFEVFVDTDSDEVLAWCKSQNNVVGYKRKKKLIGHTVSVTDLISNFIEKYKITETICQIHVTSPLLEPETIKDASLYLGSTYNSVSGCDIIHNRFWESKNNVMMPVNHDPNELKQTQDLSPIYSENSSFYIMNPYVFMAEKQRISKKPMFFPTPYPQNLDIDTMEDLDTVIRYDDRREKIDISCYNPIAVYPSSKEFKLGKTFDLEDDACCSSYVIQDLHQGTHIDSPAHFFDNGQTMDNFPSELMTGRCQIVTIDDGNLTKEKFDNLSITEDVVLFRLDNNINEIFDVNYYGITQQAAELITLEDIKMIGVNYLSVERYNNGGGVHKTLLRKPVWIIEGLDLEDVDDGLYKYYCFPLSINAEASPVRMMIEKLF